MGSKQSPTLDLSNVKIVCHFDMCAVRPEKVGELTPGGIVLPDSARQQKSALIIGTILAIGPGRERDANGIIPLPYKVGDRVVYQQTAYGGGELEVNGEKLDLIGSPNIYCTLEPAKK